jgi:D-alanyl-D-alanine carboxypeptidase/D-alanyl-D-alanine-endopeptidase (penicillin-binding protein 4)
VIASRRARLRCAAAFALLLGALPASAAELAVPTESGAPWTSAQVARLRAELDAAFAQEPAVRGAHVGLLAVDTATGAVLYARNADDAFQPASTLKLLVGSAALDRLGPQYRFRTVLAAGSGGAALIGGGDPLLTSGDLDAAATALVASGAAPSGPLAVDDGRYESAPYPAGWTWDDFAYDYAVPVSALTVDENVVHLTYGASDGGIVPLSDPALTGLSQLACPGRAALARNLARVGPAGSEDSLDTQTVAPDCAVLTGSLPDGGKTALDVAVRDPAAAAFTRLTGALRARGLAATPAPDVVVTHAGAAPAGSSVVWSHDSPPLGAWLGPRFWIPSDNLFAELLLRELAYAGGTRPGSADAGLAVERAWLRSIGVDPASTTLADGCGMSQYDRITPRDLVAILQHDWHGPNRQLVLDSLPVGGARGTIEGIAGTPAAGRVFAKTGSMMHVRGLAGFVAGRTHGAVTFAFNVDDWIGEYPALAAFRARVVSRLAGE